MKIAIQLHKLCEVIDKGYLNFASLINPKIIKQVVFSLVLLYSFVSTTSLSAQSPGDIAFTGFNADGNTTDGFSFYVAVEIPANTTIFFTDNDWDGSSLATNEGTIEWSHTSVVSAGTSIVIDDYVSGNAETTLGMATEDGGMNLSATNDALYAYTGSLGSPTTFLAALGNNTTGSSDYNLTGTGLVEGTTALSISGDNDVMVMTADLSAFCPGGTCAENIYDASNWALDNGGGDQSSDGGGTTDFPASVSNPESGTPLPIELLSFTASMEANTIRLYWSTATEVNNDYFIIEKSNDDGENFAAIVKINGAGTTSSLSEYSYTDHFLLTGQTMYYRLKQVDFDGTSTTSKIIFLSPNLGEVKFYPNPFTDELNIQGVSDQTPIAYVVVSPQGKVSTGKSKKSKLIEILKNSAPGLYYLKIGTQSFSLVKK